MECKVAFLSSIIWVGCFDRVIGIKLICEGSARENMAWQVDIHENNNISGLINIKLLANLVSKKEQML
jgi:hypothetical protein